MDAEILTARFHLRPLQESDVSERYLSWMQDADARRYIVAASQTRDLSDLRAYVRERCGREDVLFLGIFERVTELHIGNIKYEPIDVAEGAAVMGILIGDVSWRGKAVTAEVLAASGRWLGDQRGIRRITLGVDRENVAAIRAYQRVGFVADAAVSASHAGSAMTMTWIL